MELKQIKTFITIVEWGSFSEAANQLYLSQPTVSLHIKQLENELGIELIGRTTKSHELTPHGEKFYEYAKSIMQMAYNIENTFSQKNNHKFTIGASSIAASYILPQLISAFSRKYPDNEITLFQSDTIKVINDIALGSLNLGIVGSQSMNNNLKFERIFQDKLVIATAYNDHFLALQASNPSIQELLRHPFISREDGSGTLKESAMLLREMKIDPLKLDKVLEVNNNEAIKQFIKLGTGISIISELAVINEVKNKEILTFPIDHKLSNRDFYLVHRKNSHLTDASRHFVEFVRKIDLNNLNFDISIDEEDEDDEDEPLNKDKTKKKKTKNSSKSRDFHRMVKPKRIHRKINN